jgi:hypothetical protein
LALSPVGFKPIFTLESDSNPAGEKADHTVAILAATIDPIYESPPKFDSEGGREVYMVGNREELLDKMIEEI